MQIRTAALIPILIAILTTSGTLSSQDTTLRINTRLVQLDVVVRDKAGPVATLTKDDFTVLDNGKPQRIDVFSMSTVQPSSPTPAAPPSSRGTVSNRWESQPEKPVAATVILFDLLNTSQEHQNYGTQQLLRYLKSLNSDDRIALYILENELHVVQDFTSDPETLIRAASNIEVGNVPGNELRSVRDIVRAIGGGRGSF